MKLKYNLANYLEFYKSDVENKKEPKFFELILVLGVITLCLANVYAQKVITVFDHNISMSGIIFPFTFLFLILINEVYGHQKCGRAVVAMLCGQFIFLLCLWQFSLISTPSLTKASAMETDSLRIAFGNYSNVIIGSMLAVGFSFYFFSILNSWLKVKLCRLNPFLRFLLSVGIAKVILVITAYTFNLWDIVTLKQLIVICVNTWFIKMIIAIFIILISAPLIKQLKRIDREDTYDLDVSYNPIKLYSDDSKGINLYEAIQRRES